MTKQTFRLMIAYIDSHLHQVQRLAQFNEDYEGVDQIDTVRDTLKFMTNQVNDSEVKEAFHALEKLTKDLMKANDKQEYETLVRKV